MNVMKRAWEIAKAGASKFGGKSKEFFRQALIMAWAEKRRPVKAEVELPADTKKYRTWLAAITGTHPTFKLDRKFLNPDTTDSWGDKIFYLTDGFYESNDCKRRHFIQVVNGIVTRVEKEEVYAAFGV